MPDTKNPNIILISLIYLIPALLILPIGLYRLNSNPDTTPVIFIAIFVLAAVLSGMAVLLSIIGSIRYQIKEKPSNWAVFILFDIGAVLLILFCILTTPENPVRPLNIVTHYNFMPITIFPIAALFFGFVVFGIREAGIRERRISLGFLIAGLVFLVYEIAASIGGSDVPPFSNPPLYSPVLMILLYLIWAVLGVLTAVFLIRSVKNSSGTKGILRILLSLGIIAILLSACCVFLLTTGDEGTDAGETLILPASVIDEMKNENYLTVSFPGSIIPQEYMILAGNPGDPSVSVAKTLKQDDPVILIVMDYDEYVSLISHTPPERVMIPAKYVYDFGENLSQTLAWLAPRYAVSAGDETISVNIFFPAEGGETSYGDVVPPWGVVRAFISSKNEIADVFVRSTSYGEEKITPLDPYPWVLAQYPTTPGNTSITLVATDVFGNTAEQTVNFTVVRVVPVPPKP